MKMSDEAVITYDYDPDQGIIEFFVNLESICYWNCDGDIKKSVAEFSNIFDEGVEYGKLWKNDNES